METKHTPGPWKLSQTWVGLETKNPDYPVKSDCALVWKPVAKMQMEYGNPKEHVANANLICASPDLLAALQKAFQIENEVKQTEAQAKISIVKVEASAKIRAINAEAYAEATVKEAKADAEANRIKQQSITPLLIQWQLAMDWDGKLPVYGQVPTLFKDIAK